MIGGQKGETMKITVSQTFETFGDPCKATFTNEAAAEEEADKIAEGIAEAFYACDGDDAVIEFYDSCGRTGYAHEIQFHQSLSDDSGATKEADGKIPWATLVSRIREAAVEIETETLNPTEQ